MAKVSSSTTASFILANDLVAGALNFELHSRLIKKKLRHDPDSEKKAWAQLRTCSKIIFLTKQLEKRREEEQVASN